MTANRITLATLALAALVPLAGCGHQAQHDVQDAPAFRSPTVCIDETAFTTAHGGVGAACLGHETSAQ